MNERSELKLRVRYVVPDFHEIRLVDPTTLVRLQDLQGEWWGREGRELLLGLEHHVALSEHPLAVQINHTTMAS